MEENSNATRFPNNGGLGYALLNYDAASDTLAADPSPDNCGHACHVAVKTKDYMKDVIGSAQCPGYSPPRSAQ
jgi:hypothetical protein